VEELKSGYGEILKLSITGENQFYNVFKKSIEKNGFSLVDVVELIRHSLLAKKPIIELDEHETDLRRILNYGHSFGHAIEAITRGEITHGDAIVFGMDLINFIGVKKKITREEFAEEFHQFVAKNFLHVKIPSNLQAIQLLEEVRKDKKRTHEFMNFIIPKDLGELKVVSCKLDEELVSMINEYLDECIFDRY
jgi:3-dehydroquinate synthase